MLRPIPLCVGLLIALTSACVDPEPDGRDDPAQSGWTPEVTAAVERLMGAPQVIPEPGLTASILVSPGHMFDPLTLIPRGDGVWLNDDGGELGEQGGRIFAVDRDGTVSTVVEMSRLRPPTGFDVAPEGFGAFGGQIFTVSQPRSTSLGTRRNHVILRVDPQGEQPAEIVCTLPTHGAQEGGIPGGGLDARFGPPDSSFANRLFAVTIFNGTVYQITADGECEPFVTFEGPRWTRPMGIAFSADRARMLVAVSSLNPSDGPGAIVSVAADGMVDPEPIVAGIERAWGLAVAPPEFGMFAGQVFFTTGGQPMPVGNPTGNGTLYRLTADQGVARVASGFFRPTGIAFVDESIWVADVKGDFIPGQQLPDGSIVKLEPQ